MGGSGKTALTLSSESRAASAATSSTNTLGFQKTLMAVHLMIQDTLAYTYCSMLLSQLTSIEIVFGLKA